MLQNFWSIFFIYKDYLWKKSKKLKKKCTQPFNSFTRIGPI